jgi:GTPase SAR1 family protein
MNPFRVPDSENNIYSSSLDPCRCNEHEKYYAPVDNTKKAYDEYCDFLKEFSNKPRCHAVLFHGETGCGKTSLMNRCLKLVKDTRWKLDRDELEPYIIDLRTEIENTKSAEAKINDILDHIHYSLEENVITEDLYKNFGKKLGKDTNLVLRFLASKMKNHKRLLVILFPVISTKEDIKQYLKFFYRSNWILYFESENLDSIQYCRRNYRETSNSPVKCLKVKPLSETDGNIFITKRLSLLSDEDRKVDFEKEGVEKYLASRGKASIKELEIVCGRAFTNALCYNKSVIGFDDMAQAAISILQFQRGC